MKGIILAGGSGTRLYPMTKVISKQLLPIYDKPMIYYPLSVLMLTGIREILVITSSDQLEAFKKLLGDGSQWGISLSYEIQDEPKGIAEAFIIGESFLDGDSVCLILGDNVFYGQQFSRTLEDVEFNACEAIIYGYPVRNPSDFGVVTFDEAYNVISIEEKPVNPTSKYAVPGLYFYSNTVCDYAKKVQPSARGELEITAINQMYLESGKLKVVPLSRGIAWLDTGTPQGMLQASEYVETLQSRQGLYIACLEEIAWRKGFISHDQMIQLGLGLSKTSYGQYILDLV